MLFPNLTGLLHNIYLQMYPSKYSKLVEDENGLELMREIIIHPAPYERIKELAQMVIDNYNEITERWKPRKMDLDG